MTPEIIEGLRGIAEAAGVEDAGAGLNSPTSWMVALVAMLLLLALGAWRTTRGRRR